MRRALSGTLQHLAVRQANPEARQLVLGVIAQNAPITVQDLYKLTAKEQEKMASDGESLPIPSMRYLKKVVLPHLQHIGKVEKVHEKAVVSPEEVEKLRANSAKSNRKPALLPTHVQYWRWQLKTPGEEEPPKKEKKLFGTEVGVGEDWSHLNKRRQRAREEKVARDVQWLKELTAAREAGRAESS